MKRDINNFKILFILKNNESISFDTRNLAKKTKINYKNIGRYLSKLENMGFIEREIFQEGKKRFILNTLTKKGKNYEIPDFYKFLLTKIYF